MFSSVEDCKKIVKVSIVVLPLYTNRTLECMLVVDRCKAQRILHMRMPKDASIIFDLVV
jgi:hypothetical protein